VKQAELKHFRLLSGNQMVAEAAVAAGCRFFAGYPITPASGIYKNMIEFLQRRGDIAISAPDEISALAYCVGASMRGMKAMTATSGPGWALMIETVQYALMTETPVVIAYVQRLGPSTGGATQGAQGDVMLAEFCTSGGYTIPVFCPSTLQQCFDLTLHAFSVSELLRTPVIVLLDKEVGMTTESIDASFAVSATAASRLMFDAHKCKNGSRIHMYDFNKKEEVPAFITIGETVKVTATGSAHNKNGALKKNDTETLEVLLHLEEKIRAHTPEITIVENNLEANAETLIVSYGISARTTHEVVRQLRREGKRVSCINTMTLFPIPEHALRHAARGTKRVVVVEENMNGQYRSLIRHLFVGKEVVGVNKIGAMITPREIINEVRV
jgi:2-oxoglutarate ferredoxin oxidoreductase subunit alpha